MKHSRRLGSQDHTAPFWVTASCIAVLAAVGAASLWPLLHQAAQAKATWLVQSANNLSSAEADLTYELAGRLDPTNETAAFHRASREFVTGHPDRVRHIIDRAIDRGRGMGPHTNTLHIKALLELGDHKAAVTSADLLVPQTRQDDQLFVAALAYGAAGQEGRLNALKARLSSPETLQRVQRLQGSKTALGMELYALGLLRSSQTLLTPLPDSLPRNLILGHIAYHERTPQSLAQAEDYYTKVLELDPSHQEARQGLMLTLRALAKTESAAKQTGLLGQLKAGQP